MAPSQLKQLKASLHSSGILGPQKSKKQKQQAHQSGSNKDARVRAQRQAALTSIREKFNPFEARAPSRPNKYDVASNKPTKTRVERPGVTRGLGEERRRETLLKEMQSRHKIGGMVDRRFGEDDPGMTLEMKMAERFARQAARREVKGGAFNLEESDDDAEEMVLTHGGRKLEFGEKDDFEESVAGSDEEEEDADRPRKRVRLDAGEGDEQEAEDVPERKKTKKEVMEEVIAKSKMYKAMRQQAKEDDDDLRLELDKGMADFYSALNQGKAPSKRQLPSPPGTDSEPTVDPSRAAMLAGKSREEAEKEYEANLRELKIEARSQPTVRTKTEEEKAAAEKARLEDLERKRLRRMRGEADSSDEDESDNDSDAQADEDLSENDDAEAFGLAQPEAPYMPNLEVEDEDEFVMDDIVASDSEAEAASDDGADLSSDEELEPEDDGDDDFINGLVLPTSSATTKTLTIPSHPTTQLAYTFPCPQTHAELLDLTKSLPATELPTVIQRIRALYHKSLSQDNAAKLANFAASLTTHIAYLTDHTTTPLPIIEQLIRHLHSMAKSTPSAVTSSVRSHLRTISTDRPLDLTAGDLMILTLVATIFPTSDQWHPAVTPSTLTLARYLAHSQTTTLHDLAKGAYAATLLLRYQRDAKRYVPEVIAYLYKSLELLAPTPLPPSASQLRPPSSTSTATITRASATDLAAPATQKLSFALLRSGSSATQIQPTALLHTFIALTSHLPHLYATTLPSANPHTNKPTPHLSAYPEIIAPLLSHLNSLAPHLPSTLSTSPPRVPLRLHTHRPRAIRAALPLLIEAYNPSRHISSYDPDRERAELAKLRAQHRKETKGAVRELRKDAAFMAREGLREKKERDREYEVKMRRVLGEVASGN